MEIIAEIGQNHNGDMDLAVELIHAAKKSGADVAKFQVFDVATIFSKEGNPWYDYNCQTQLTYEQVVMLAEECREVDIDFGASPFDPERVSWLENVGIKRYKVASRSVSDVELLNAICKTGKGLIVSLGMWNEEKFPVISTASSVDFLYCVADYPAKLSSFKFAEIDFEKYSGFSDHSEGITASIVAFSRGARIIEKHFTLDKTMYGPDHSCSMTPEELQELHKYRLEIGQCL
jgi:sialic acid synthase SpsE